jgi:hypothetical protein
MGREPAGFKASDGGGGGRANGDDDKTAYSLQHSLPDFGIQQNGQSSDTPMKYFEPGDQIHLVKIHTPPPHTADQAISSLSATSRWRPSLHH